MSRQYGKAAGASGLLLRKRTFALLAIVAIACMAMFAVTACGGDDEPTDGDTTAAGGDEIKVKKIGISFPNSSKEGAVQFELNFSKAYAQEQGWEAIIDDPGADQNRQLNTINSWIAEGYPTLIVVALDAGPFQNIVPEAKEKGTKWMSYGAPMPGESGQVDMNQIEGGATIGKLCGDWINDELGKKAKVAILTYEQGEWARARADGIIQGLDSTGADYEIVAEQDALSETEGLEKTTLMLQANPDLNAVLAIEETATEGAYEAFINAGHPKDDPNVFLGGIDGTIKALRLLEEGDTMYRGSSAISLKNLGEGMIQAAIDLAEGAPEPVIYKTEYTPLTSGDPAIADFIAEWESKGL